MLKENLRNYIAEKHVAGPELGDALSVCRAAAERKFGTILSVWTQEKCKTNFTSSCLEIIDAIIKEKLDCYLSIKPSLLDFDIKQFCELAAAAGKNNIRIHFDSLTYDLAPRSLEFIKKAKFLYSNVGYTLPSRWLRSREDAEEIAKLRVPVRIVKGQWKDPGYPEINTKKNFLEILRILANKSPIIAIATHDFGLAKEAVLILKESGHNGCEIEQFFSLPLNCKKLTELYNIKFRLYVAYGKPYLPYNINNVFERPVMIKWLVKDLMTGKRRNLNFCM